MKAKMCKCGHAQRHHCKKTNVMTGEYWYGACYYPMDEVRKDTSKIKCSCMRFESVDIKEVKS